MAEPFDPYAVLGVRPGASLTEIAHARRALAKSFHPDTAGAEGEESMRRVNLAWEMLRADRSAVKLPPPPWQRTQSAKTAPSRTSQPSGGNAGWWVLALVGLLFAAILVAAIIGAMDGGTMPAAPWLQDNLGN